jgi:endonuclease YncB( thermonuclease family)
MRRLQLILLYLIYFAGSALAQQVITGRATVIDGDTIEIRGEHVRLNGIDAPEGKQTCNNEKGETYRCGAMAARRLDEFLAASRPTRCAFVERDRYGRFVGDCLRADGASVARYMVRNGFALDYRQHSKGKYAADEEKARQAKRGLWIGKFTPPWEWRAQQRATAETTGSLPSGDCRIKGNISRKGRRIYHLPGQQDYEKTRITESRGERWFCSEAEAQAAGWTAAKH